MTQTLPPQTNQLQYYLDQYVQQLGVNATTESIRFLTTQIIAQSKSPLFFDQAFQELENPQISKEKATLITSLIKDKFKYDYEMINKNKMGYYLAKLSQIAFNFTGKNKLSYSITTNISLTVSYIYINFVSERDLLIHEFLDCFIPKNNQNHIYNYFFKTLQNIAGQIDSSKLVIDQIARENAKARILGQQENIMVMLNESIQHIWGLPEVNTQHIIECFQAWICLSGSSEILNFIGNHWIVGEIFKYIQSLDKVDTCTECVKSILNIMKTPEEMPQIYTTFGNYILNLPETIDKIIKHYDYADETKQLLIILVRFTKKSLTLFVNAYSEYTQNILKKFIRYMNAPYINDDPKIQVEIRQFWEDFITVLTTQSRKNTETFIPRGIIRELYHAVVQNVSFSQNVIRQFEKFTQLRLIQKVSEVDEKIQKRCGYQHLYQLLSKLIGVDQYLTQVIDALGKVGLSNWALLQSYLFSCVTPIQNKEPKQEFVDYFINCYESINNSDFGCPVVVQRVFLKLFKAILSRPKKESQKVNKMYFFIINNFQHQFLKDVAQKSFLKACEENCNVFLSNPQNLISLIQAYPYRQKIIQGVVLVLRQDNGLVYDYIPSVFDFILTAAQSTENGNDKLRCFSAAANLLEKFASSPFQDLKNYMKPMIQKHWAYIVNILVAHTDEQQNPYAERIVRLIKHIFRFQQENMFEYLQDFYNTILNAFRFTHRSQYLYLVEIGISAFHKYQVLKEFMCNIYFSFCQLTFAYLNNCKSIEDASCLIDDFYGMNRRFLLHDPQIVVRSNQFKQILQFSFVKCIGCQSTRIAKAFLYFLQILYAPFWRSEYMEQYNDIHKKMYFKPFDQPSTVNYLKSQLLGSSESLLKSLMSWLQFYPVESTRDCISDVIIAQILAFPQENVDIWWRVFDTIPSDILLCSEKEKFIDLIKTTGQSQPKSVLYATHQSLERMIHMITKRYYMAYRRLHNK